MPQPATPKPGLSVFFPAYNDSGTIASLVITALQTARRLTPDCEVIIVNDGSADATAEIADELARTYPEVQGRAPSAQPRLRRRAAQRLRGGDHASLVFYTDGDAQYDPAEMALLWDRLDDDVDVVNGYKISRSDPFHRIVIGRIYHHTVQAAVRPEGARRRLRLPADAAIDLRQGARSRRTAASSAWR